MANIKADGNRMIDCGKDIVALAKEYENIIEEMFVKIRNIESTGWNGVAAVSFIKDATLDKNQYIFLGRSLEQYGNYMIEVGSKVNNITNKIEQRR